MRGIDHYKRNWKAVLVQRYLRHLQIYCDAIRAGYENKIPHCAEVISQLAKLNCVKNTKSTEKNKIIKNVNHLLFSEIEKANGLFKPLCEWKNSQPAQIAKKDSSPKGSLYGIPNTHLKVIIEAESNRMSWSDTSNSCMMFSSNIRNKLWRQIDQLVGNLRVPYDKNDKFWNSVFREDHVKDIFAESSKTLDSTGLAIIKELLINSGHRFFCQCHQCKKPFIDFFYFKRNPSDTNYYCPEQLYVKTYCRQYHHRANSAKKKVPHKGITRAI